MTLGREDTASKTMANSVQHSLPSNQLDIAAFIDESGHHTFGRSHSIHKASTDNRPTVAQFSRRCANNDKVGPDTSCTEEIIHIGTFWDRNGHKCGVAGGKFKHGLSASHPSPLQSQRYNNGLPLVDCRSVNTRQLGGGRKSQIEMDIRAQSARTILTNTLPRMGMPPKSASVSHIRCSSTKCQTRGWSGEAPILLGALGRLRQQSAKRRRERLSPAGGGRRLARRAQSAGPSFACSTPSMTMRGWETPSLDVTSRSGHVTDTTSMALVRFRRAARLVQLALHCMKIIIELSGELSMRTAAEMQWYTLNSSKEAKKLAFNPSLYAQNRVYAKVPKWAKHVLSRDPDRRTQSDCHRLHALLRGLKAFDKFTEKIQLSMCQSFTYECIESQRVILREGHVGQNFYIVYSGSVFVNVRDVNSQGVEFVKTEVVLSKGDSFGELALLQDILRTATISCRETCELLVVDKDTFAKICPKIFDRELEEKIKFMRKLPLFHPKYWTDDSIQNMCFEAQIQEYKTNKVIVLDSSQDEWMYICMEGRCRIIKCLALDYEEEQLATRLGRRRSTLLPEDKLLTAEYLETQQSESSDEESDQQATRDGESSTLAKKVSFGKQRKSSINFRTKKQLLNSLGLTFLDKEQINMPESLQKAKVMIQNSEEKTTQEHRQKSLQGVITLTQLMTRRHEEGRDGFVYLHIGIMETQQIFDLVTALKPNANVSKSSLVLVSSGAKTLRLKKQTFLKWMSSDALVHAKHIAMQNLYPSSSVLLNSYKQKCGWDVYKQKVLAEAVRPLANKARHKQISRYMAKLRLASKKQASQVMHTLKKGKGPEDEEEGEEGEGDAEEREGSPEGYALDDPEPDIYDGFVSKSLRENDAVVCPQNATSRRKSIFIPTGLLARRRSVVTRADVVAKIHVDLHVGLPQAQDVY